MQKNQVFQAVKILNRGGLVAIPTETVYGLGADAQNVTAIKKIFAVKQRPMNHPLIVHINDIVQLSDWAFDISPEAFLLAQTFWPGPLTLILKKAPNVLAEITGGQQTVGLRVPNHPVALAILKELGRGMVAPSANRFGRISPTTSQAVYEELGDAVDFIVEGGQCEVGVESTIVDVSGKSPTILRPGMISATQITGVLQQTLAVVNDNSPRVSGSHASHYAPLTQTILMTRAQLISFLKTEPQKVAVMAFTEFNGNNIVKMSTHPAAYAHNLYKILRNLDNQAFKQIIIEKVPETTDWDAIRDRIQRATASGFRHDK